MSPTSYQAAPPRISPRTLSGGLSACQARGRRGPGSGAGRPGSLLDGAREARCLRPAGPPGVEAAPGRPSAGPRPRFCCAWGTCRILWAAPTGIFGHKDRIRLIEEVKSKYGRLDLLVNNAGVAPKQRLDILEATEESFERLISINLKGPYFLTQLAANWMIEQMNAYEGRNPKIINISSISAFTSSPSRGEYCISKAGISMMTKLYADRLADYGIQVFEIQPGVIETDMTRGVKEKYDRLIEEGMTPIKRWGYPEDIAKAVAAIATGAFPFSTGEVIHVDGGFHLRRL